MLDASPLAKLGRPCQCCSMAGPLFSLALFPVHYTHGGPGACAGSPALHNQSQPINQPTQLTASCLSPASPCESALSCLCLIVLIACAPVCALGNVLVTLFHFARRRQHLRMERLTLCVWYAPAWLLPPHYLTPVVAFWDVSSHSGMGENGPNKLTMVHSKQGQCRHCVAARVCSAAITVGGTEKGHQKQSDVGSWNHPPSHGKRVQGMHASKESVVMERGTQRGMCLWSGRLGGGQSSAARGGSSGEERPAARRGVKREPWLQRCSGLGNGGNRAFYAACGLAVQKERGLWMGSMRQLAFHEGGGGVRMKIGKAAPGGRFEGQG